MGRRIAVSGSQHSNNTQDIRRPRQNKQEQNITPADLCSWPRQQQGWQPTVSVTAARSPSFHTPLASRPRKLSQEKRKASASAIFFRSCTRASRANKTSSTASATIVTGGEWSREATLLYRSERRCCHHWGLRHRSGVFEAGGGGKEQSRRCPHGPVGEKYGRIDAANVSKSG